MVRYTYAQDASAIGTFAMVARGTGTSPYNDAGYSFPRGYDYANTGQVTGTFSFVFDNGAGPYDASIGSEASSSGDWTMVAPRVVYVTNRQTVDA